MATIKLDDREMSFRFTMWSARKFKEVYGLPIVECFFAGPGQKATRIADSVCMTNVVWAGLIPDKPKLTVQQVEQMLDRYLSNGATLVELYKKVGDAMKESGLFSGLLDNDEPQEKEGEGNPQIAE